VVAQELLDAGGQHLADAFHRGADVRDRLGEKRPIDRGSSPFQGALDEDLLEGLEVQVLEHGPRLPPDQGGSVAPQDDDAVANTR